MIIQRLWHSFVCRDICITCTLNILFCFQQFAELETLLGDIERARAIYELAVNQPRLDMPELLWKAYVDFECGQGEVAKARKLYERLLERTHHVKVKYLLRPTSKLL